MIKLSEPRLLLAFLLTICCLYGCRQDLVSIDSEDNANLLPVSSEGAITKEDSRIQSDGAKRNEFPKEDDLSIAITFFVQDRIEFIGRPVYDDFTFKYIPNAKIYLIAGTVIFITIKMRMENMIHRLIIKEW